MIQGLKYFRFDALLLQQGWMKPAYAGIDVKGVIQYLEDHSPQLEGIAIETVNGIALPGFPNAHSHAFQFAMAGMAEKHRPGASDDFWSWREAMYDCALSIDPDQLETIAAMLYSEMLRMGYTHVAEFHYLHHDLKGSRYSCIAENGSRLLAAAKTAGIKITLIPVFYQKGGFGMEPEPQQRRFISATLDEYLKLLDETKSIVNQNENAWLGFGVHSLRAVSVADIFRTIELGPREVPFHLHAAEQHKEVHDCKAYLKQRPVEWILNNLPVQERFNLVHCTHLNDDEIKRLANSRANVVLCPGTEGNLGDGIFRLTEFANHYGNWCIGTDSHISLNPLEDLRWLDYAQRLTTHKRNTFDDGANVLINKSITCGRKSVGLKAGNFFEKGQSLDAVIFNSKSPLLHPSKSEHHLPTIVYTADSSSISGTIVNGKWVVKNQNVMNAASIQAKYSKTIHELQAGFQ